ncbi:two-component system, NtrC family, C4-dicarboxylate transport sensor histidine kinase DctB [Halomonas shengliensis]|uniref:C4-dicarboxylate transport sensor protein DctB n=1 Tax=Halomonas shengliensis TaxID=419597 RepID=A0A1H0JY32_9GAMM|nr:ATP-binding protein [Halomonas shengliensis]SDO48655.1 two-component system, NtrC family, C4-dicarboxylate transport sensor histidine kinase DctB [Halomonas shengliensis]
MTAAAEASRLPRRWRHWLWWLAPLGLVLVVWQAADVARQQALQSLQQDAENELRLSATGLTGYLSRHAYLPRLLASREAVRRFLAAPQSQDAMPLNLLLDRFRATTGVSDIYLLDRHADTLAASNWHRPNTFIGENYAFRSYYTDAIAGRPGRFYGLGVQSLERGYYFSAPVWLDDTAPDATPDGVMVVKVLLDAVEASWAEQEAELLVTDADDIIFMASRPELRMASLAPLSAAERRALLATRRYADEPLDHSGFEVLERLGQRSRLVGFAHGPLAGQRFLGLRRALPELGWEMQILKPLDPVVRAQWVSALLAGGLYGMVLLGGGIGWQRLRLRRERELFAERERHTLARARDELERNVASRTRDLVETNRRLSDEVEERKRAEADLRRTRDELIQAAKLAVLGQLAAGINHELNQPLAAIRAYAENARAFLARERLESADRNLAEIVELTGRMAEISAQLRQFSRKGDERRSAVSVTDCFEYALRLFQARLQEAGVRVERRFPAAPAWVDADPVRLEQVLVNLIGNALQAMAGTAAPSLTLSVRADHETIELAVEDSGPGIPPEQLTRIFEPFFTTKSPGSGLGLGLSISSRIIDDLGGRLFAENRAEGGARFVIRLPRTRPAAASSIRRQENAPHA